MPARPGAGPERAGGTGSGSVLGLARELLKGSGLVVIVVFWLRTSEESQVKRRHFIMLAGTTAVATPALRSQALLASNRAQWQPDGFASVARIGVLTPDDDPVPESEMGIMAPKGASIHASRVPWNHDALSFVEHAADAVELLARVTPRVILYAFTSSTYLLGTQGDDELRTSLGKRAGGIPVIFTCSAAVEALRILGARRVALFHPPWFAEDINHKGMEYFRTLGMEVVFCERMMPTRTFTEVPPAEVYEWVRTKAPRQAEAVFIGGNGLRAIGVIHALEETLHKPVLTANQVLFWEALRMLGVTSKLTEYGLLLSKSSPTR